MHIERTVVLHSTLKAQISTFFYLEPFPRNYSSLKHVAPTFKYKENHLQVPHSQHLLAAHQLVSIFQVHQSWRVFPDLPATGPNRNDRHQIHREWCCKNKNMIFCYFFFRGTQFGYPYTLLSDTPTSGWLFCSTSFEKLYIFCTRRVEWVIKWETFWWNSTISLLINTIQRLESFPFMTSDKTPNSQIYKCVSAFLS